MHNDDYLAERERVVFKVQRWTRLREENTDAWTRAGMGPKGPKGLKSVDNHTARYNDEFVKESAAGYYVGSMGVEKDPGVLEPVPFATKAEAQAFCTSPSTGSAQLGGRSRGRRSAKASLHCGAGSRKEDSHRRSLRLASRITRPSRRSPSQRTRRRSSPGSGRRGR